MTVEGSCAEQFAQVQEEFERSFAERGEVGAAVCVMHRGEIVVDLWGGTTVRGAGRAWQRDTLTHVWSATKGATALCAHMLASRGELDLNAPVVRYWPEFGKHGKEAILVRHLLNHQAGLPAVRQPLPPGSFYDWQHMVDVLAEEEPFWKPGTRNGYHALTFGYLVGEVVRRVSGQSLGTFFRREVAEPLGLDFWIGLPEEHEPRVAPTIPADVTAPGIAVPSLYTLAFSDPTSLAGMMLVNNGGYMTVPGESNSREAHAAEIGAVGGITDARSLAGMYRPLALGGGDLVSADQLALMAAVSSSTSVDAVLQVPSRFSLGFVKSVDNSYLPPADSEGVQLSEEAFGHIGMGGSLGFADPRAGLSFGYVMNQQGIGLALNPRGQSLVDAVYRAIGYRQIGSTGSWYTN